jgi:hypothetical protein
MTPLMKIPFAIHVDMEIQLRVSRKAETENRIRKNSGCEVFLQKTLARFNTSGISQNKKATNDMMPNAHGAYQSKCFVADTFSPFLLMYQLQ